MSEHYLTSQYDKKSKYNYGLKNSNLYGANLGSVFADGPPPLDDTLEDDDGDIVFRDNQSKLAANLSDTSKASQLCNESINGASISNQNTSPDPSDNTKDDDFGGFASFGNFSDDGNAKDSLATSWTITPSNATKTSPSIEKFPKDSNRKTENSLKASDNFGCFSDSDEEFESFQSSEVQPDMHAVKSSNGSVLPVNLSPNNFHVSNVDGDDFQSHHIKESIPDNHVSKVAKSPGVQDGFECFSDSDDDFESFQSSQVPSNLPAYKSSTSVQVSNNQPSNHNDKHASGSEGILFDTGKSGTTNKEEPHEIDDHKKVESLGNLSSDEDFGDFALHSPPPLDDLTSSKTGHSDIESISSGDNGFGGSTCKDNSFSPKEMASSTSDSQLDSKREQGNSDYGFKDSGGSQSGSKGISIVKSRHVSDSQRNRDSPKELRHQGDNRHFSCAALSSDKEPGDNHFGEFAESSSEGQQSSKELPSLQMDISSYSGKDTPDDDNSFSNLQAITKGNEDGVEQPTDNSIHATVASHNDDDFDDFDGFKASIPTTTDSKSDDPHIYKIRFEKNEDDDFGDFDGFKASVTTTTDSKFEGSHGHKMGLEEKQKEDDDDFGDFDGFKASVTTTTDSKLEGSHGHKMGFEENQNEDDDDFGDFDGFKVSIPTTTDSKIKGSHCYKTRLEENQNEDDDDFGDFDGFKASVTTTTDSKFEGSHGHKMVLEENQNEDDDDFGDFDGFKTSITTTTDSKIEGSHGCKTRLVENQIADDNEFGSFDGLKASALKTDDEEQNSKENQSAISTEDNEDNGFDDFHTSTPSAAKDDFNAFSGSPENLKNQSLKTSVMHTGADNDDDDNHDGFADFDDFKSSEAIPAKDNFDTFSSAQKASPPEQKQLKSTETSDSDDYGDFSNFETPTKESYNKSDGCTGQKGKLNANKDDDFGDFSDSDMKSNSLKTVIPKIALQTKQSQANPSNEKERVDDGFADFSSSETSGFAEFSSANKSHSDPSDTTFKKTSIETTTISQSSTSQKGLSIFKPHPNSMISQLAGPVSLSITRPDDFKLGKSLVVSFLLKILENNKSSSMLKELLMSQQDGSLRFEWSLSCHHSKLLEALNMLPVRSQTTTSFQSTSKSTVMPFFSTGMGLLEPTRGGVAPSHTQDTTFTQDPFSLPSHSSMQFPNVGLGLAKSALSRQSAPLDSKDNSSSDSLSSESSSLDLDFLASSTSERKPENRGVYEQELLGLSLQPSDTASPSPFAESPSLPSGAEAKKVFKFGNVLIPLNSDQGNKDLSGAAKEIADDLEDLSFMLSKVLMFPLKSK
ncbi:dentin sialophosphoprotein isoform X2 [Nematostella vectensis]|uniref:dentin sialophosphoprotein isoform X2 n=1 Tax=Nematostella vectensis TaxID=45351 RepID=UPI0020778422|nr:dentin sialophosphoprotein isoform X2 [Nematostella vectensis]